MQIAIDTFVFDNNFYLIEKIKGLDAPPLRIVNTPNAGMHGAQVMADYFGSRPVTIEGYVYGDGGADLLAKLDAIATFMTPADRTLTIDDRVVFCRPAGFTFDHSADLPFAVPFQASFIAADPIIYGSTANSGNIALPTATGGRSFPKSYPIAYGTISTGGRLVARNAGNIVVAPTVKIFGPVDNPRLMNITQNKSVELATSVIAGDCLVIDFAHKTVMLNGAASRYSALTTSDWWDLRPGNNEISYGASTYQAGSYALLSWRDGYLTA